ncbi:MAG TPA: hypothetical protein VKU90_09320 [Caulobacteraceae bacterium]|nr:hypothetical protein [Caulobacteraceae bacterium]
MPETAVLQPPWSASWSGEQEFRLRRSADFPGMIEVDQKEAPGDGEPLFAVIHLNRHRRAIIDLLCHVCGEPTEPSDRYIFPVASGGMVTLHDGTQQYGCNVSPIHLACAERAARDCPQLNRLREHPLRCSDDEGRLIHRTDATPGLEALAASLPPGQEVVFSCYRLYEPAFTQTVMAAREAWERAGRARRAAGERPQPPRF